MRLATTSLAALAALSTTDTGVLARVGVKSTAAEKKPINKLTNSLRKATTTAVALTAALAAPGGVEAATCSTHPVTWARMSNTFEAIANGGVKKKARRRPAGGTIRSPRLKSRRGFRPRRE